MNEHDIEKFFAANPAVGASVKRQEFENMRQIVQQVYGENRGLKKKMDNLAKLVKGFIEEEDQDNIFSNLIDTVDQEQLARLAELLAPCLNDLEDLNKAGG